MDFIASTNFIIIECCIMQHSLTVQKVNMKSTNLIGTQMESYALEEDGSQLWLIFPTGQISNHYRIEDWNLFNTPERWKADEWDGHTPVEAANRLYRFCLHYNEYYPIWECQQGN